MDFLVKFTIVFLKSGSQVIAVHSLGKRQQDIVPNLWCRWMSMWIISEEALSRDLEARKEILLVLHLIMDMVLIILET